MVDKKIDINVANNSKSILSQQLDYIMYNSCNNSKCIYIALYGLIVLLNLKYN